MCGRFGKSRLQAPIDEIVAPLGRSTWRLVSMLVIYGASDSRSNVCVDPVSAQREGGATEEVV